MRVDLHAIDHVGWCFKLPVGETLGPLSQTHASVPSEACNAHLLLLGIGNLDLTGDDVPPVQVDQRATDAFVLMPPFGGALQSLYKIGFLHFIPLLRLRRRC